MDTTLERPLHARDATSSRVRALRREWLQALAHTDALFALVSDQTLRERPVPDRHRLIFYIGHLDAFDWNQLARGVLDAPAFNAGFDQLFERGIDPPPGQAPADSPTDWPALAEVRAYVARARQELDLLWHRLPEDRLLTALEHRWMHAETLAYLLHALAPEYKRAPVRRQLRALQPPPQAGWVRIAAGRTTLGQDCRAFGWDNEFPQHTRPVDSFELARHKLTNGEYLRFVQDGAVAPPFWQRHGSQWWLRRMFDAVPLPLHEPVYLTHQQAADYAHWAGARLPTEAEWQLAAYGAVRPYPWGDDMPASLASRANADFVEWDLLPVNAHPRGATPEGVQQMLGNGWEWTASPFAGFDGFAPRAYYPGYSADFFDGEHFVLKGASPRTAARLARPSFRNWFRDDYPYAYTTARLARNCRDQA